MVRSTGVGGLIVSKTGTLDAKNSGEVFVDDILLCREDFFS